MIVFNNGKRVEKRVAQDKIPELKATVRKLREKGVRVCVVPSTPPASRMYPPDDEVSRMRQEGKLWCPYCGEWRWFRVPKAYPTAAVGTREWFMNSFRSQEILVCAWCEISVFDYHVGVANGIHGEVRGSRRKRRRKPGTRKRVSRRSI